MEKEGYDNRNGKKAGHHYFVFPFISPFPATRCCTQFGLQGSQWIAMNGETKLSLSSPIMSSFSFKHEIFEYFCTLCAGTRLTNTVSNSSWETVSPSQMMELIRSTMCMCTFWLWPLLAKWNRHHTSMLHIILKVLFNNDSHCGWACMSTSLSAT